MVARPLWFTCKRVSLPIWKGAWNRIESGRLSFAGRFFKNLSEGGFDDA